MWSPTQGQRWNSYWGYKCEYYSCSRCLKLLLCAKSSKHKSQPNRLGSYTPFCQPLLSCITKHPQKQLITQHIPQKLLWSPKKYGLKTQPKDFPGGAVVENLPANAGVTGSNPGLGGSHMPRSDWAREPQLLSLRVWSPCSSAGGTATVRGPRTAMKSGPRLPQLEKALAQKQRPNTAKNK